MNDIVNNGQDIRDTATHDSGSMEQKNAGKRPAISAKAQTILSFLRSCTPYEADSIRVMVNYATGEGGTDIIEATDMLAVNRFLNHGLNRGNGVSGEAVMIHRQTRAQKLMEAVKEFVDIGQLCRVSVALMRITSDTKAVEDAWRHLQPGTPTNDGKN